MLVISFRSGDSVTATDMPVIYCVWIQTIRNGQPTLPLLVVSTGQGGQSRIAHLPVFLKAPYPLVYTAQAGVLNNDSKRRFRVRHQHHGRGGDVDDIGQERSVSLLLRHANQGPGYMHGDAGHLDNLHHRAIPLSLQLAS